jgi:preprotein translocase subunit SecA
MIKFITQAVTKMFGTKSDRDIKELMPYVQQTNAEYEKLRNISDDQLRNRTTELKGIINKHLEEIDQQIEELQKQLKDNPEMDVDDKETLFNEIDRIELVRNEELEKVLLEILPQAFAVVKETARRFKENQELVVQATVHDKFIAAKKKNVVIENDTKAIWKNSWMAAGNEIVWDMLHYDVQLIGGSVLHQGKIAEMATGEGKTLVSTLPAYLNALGGRGVHIVTVNDYLAKRDSEWNAPLFEFHGLKVDCIDFHEPNSDARREAYLADITYGTNNEFGFDYLRDNMARSPEDQVQRRHHFAMVDEVDSVLVDDARTPLIIAGPMVQDTGDYLFEELKPRVFKLVEAQKKICQDYLIEARRLISAGNTDEGGLALFRAFRGLPKSKPLIKFLSETGIKQVLNKTEGIYLAENQRRMPEADAPLLFTIEEKNNSIELTDKGLAAITGASEDPEFFVLPDMATRLAGIEKNTGIPEQERIAQKDSLIQEYSAKAQRIHVTNQLLKAYTLFERDVEYVVADNKIMIVDEQTGRIMDGRRWSDGLHQAVEAKESVKVEDATQTYATITLQNYFRMYHKLCGMTGTAVTEAGEFFQIYKLDVVEIPTHRAISRNDEEDKVFKTVREKYNAVAQEIQELTQKGRPVLVGTTSVENSEILSRMLSIRKIEHQVLNAKQHAREADVVAQAGKPGTVTIATNMAGRGTDIKLTPDSRTAGGLAIIGTERHESRRVDRQLRGRSGRQGDPGSSQFFVSLEDNLMRLFGSDRIASVMDKLGMEEGEVIQHSMITNSIERAQKKVEENNFGMRKRLLEYDDVMNYQRNAIYKRRQNALYGDRLAIDVANNMYDVCASLIENNKTYGELEYRVIEKLGIGLPFSESQMKDNKAESLTQMLFDALESHYKNKNQALAKKADNFAKMAIGQGYTGIQVPITNGEVIMQMYGDSQKTIDTQGKDLVTEMEKFVVLNIIDQEWKEHLRDMDDLKQSVQNASYEQKDPLLIYKFEAVNLFQRFLSRINFDTISFLMKADMPEMENRQAPAKQRTQQQPKLQIGRGDASEVIEAETQDTRPQSQERVAPRQTIKIADRNQRVTVQYRDGSVKKDVKYKSVQQDVERGEAVVIG